LNKELMTKLHFLKKTSLLKKKLSWSTKNRLILKKENGNVFFKESSHEVNSFNLNNIYSNLKKGTLTKNSIFKINTSLRYNIRNIRLFNKKKKFSTY
jgi:hypothetical protein